MYSVIYRYVPIYIYVTIHIFPCCLLVRVTREESVVQVRVLGSTGRDPVQGNNSIAYSTRQLDFLMGERAAHTPGTVLSIGMQRGCDVNAQI